jgi:hypothetical protein
MDGAGGGCSDNAVINMELELELGVEVCLFISREEKGCMWRFLEMSDVDVLG